MYQYNEVMCLAYSINIVGNILVRAEIGNYGLFLH